MENENVMNNEEVVTEVMEKTAQSSCGLVEKVVIFGAGALTHAIVEKGIKVGYGKVKKIVADRKAKKEMEKDGCVVEVSDKEETGKVVDPEWEFENK